MKLSVVIPVYNEKTTIMEVLERVRCADFPKEIIIVDDCSTDGTREILQALPTSADLKIILLTRNSGKGAALRSGFAAVSGDIVVIQDADLEYDPAEYGNLIQPILANKADVVFGSRFLGGPHRVLLFWHSVGNWILTTLSNMLTDLNLTDMETCYKVFRAEVLRKITFKSSAGGKALRISRVPSVEQSSTMIISLGRSTARTCFNISRIVFFSLYTGITTESFISPAHGNGYNGSGFALTYAAQPVRMYNCEIRVSACVQL